MKSTFRCLRKQFFEIGFKIKNKHNQPKPLQVLSGKAFENAGLHGVLVVRHNP